MDHSLTTTGTQALQTLTPAQQAIVQKARGENQRPMMQSLPQIKLKNTGKEVAGLTIGSYYLQSYDGQEKTVRDIGDSPEIVILHRAYTYSYYDEQNNKSLAWTSDIQGFTERDMVTLFKNKDKVEIEFQGSYPAFKRYKQEHYEIEKPNGSVERLLEFSNILYVLFEGQIHRMIVKNTGVAGIAEGAKGADFKKPQLKSLIHFMDLAGVEHGETAFFESVCRLGTQYFPEAENPFHIMTFEYVGQNPNLGVHAELWDGFKKAYYKAREPMSSQEEEASLEARAIESDTVDIIADVLLD